MKTLREYINRLDEISRRDFIKGAGATAGLAAMGGVPGIAKAQMSPQDAEDRKNVMAYFGSVRKLINPRIKFDQTQIKPGMQCSVIVTVNSDGTITNLKPSDNSSWCNAVMQAFSELGGKLPTQGLDLLPPTPTLPKTHYRLAFSFSPNQVFPTINTEELDEAGTPDAVARVLELSNYK